MECRRGVKQGCPLSPILFDLALEQMVSGLEQGEDVGYTITGKERVAVLAYADDLCRLRRLVVDHQRRTFVWSKLQSSPVSKLLGLVQHFLQLLRGVGQQTKPLLLLLPLPP